MLRWRICVTKPHRYSHSNSETIHFTLFHCIKCFPWTLGSDSKINLTFLSYIFHFSTHTLQATITSIGYAVSVRMACTMKLRTNTYRRDGFLLISLCPDILCPKALMVIACFISVSQLLIIYGDLIFKWSFHVITVRSIADSIYCRAQFGCHLIRGLKTEEIHVT